MSAISFCSLDEAWGSMTPPDNASNIQNYTSFEKNVKNNNANNENDVNNSNMNNDSTAIVPILNNNNKLALNNGMQTQNQRNIVMKGNPNQLNDRTMNINSIDKLIDNLEKRLQILENNTSGNIKNSLSNIFNSNNGYIDYVILIVIGIAIIFFMNKYLNN